MIHAANHSAAVKRQGVSGLASMQNPNDDFMRGLDDQQIGVVCRHFEAAWKTGRPRIEEYLSDWRGEDRSRLLRELLRIEVEILRALGQPVSSADYESRFEADAETVREVMSKTTGEPGSPVFLDATWALPRKSQSFDLPQTTDGSGSTTRESTGPSRIGRYEILGEIARGGMGCILRAYDGSLDRHLAIKVGLPQENATDDDRATAAARVDELRARFLAEAQVTGKLQHPGIPPVHERGEVDDGRPFFAMKLVEGETLAQLLRERGDGADDVSRLVTIFGQICETIAYAHSRDIVHRDLKPANIMVGRFGEVQVMDWGLAKQLSTAELPESHSPKPAAVHDVFETMDGSIMGTPAYMAPEQARGEIENVDKQSDVFGLGAILCEILTGRPPFDGETAREVLHAAMAGDWQSSRQLLDQAALHEELVQLTTRCLAIDRNERPVDGSEVSSAVQAYLDNVRERLRRADIDRASSEVKYEEEKKRGRVERQRNRLWFSLFAVVAFTLLAGLGAFAWYQRSRTMQIAEEVAQEQQRLARRDRMVSEVSAALDQAEQLNQELIADLADDLKAARLLSDIDGWSARVASARTAVANAEQVSAADQALMPEALTSRLASVHAQVAKAEEDYGLARRLDTIRLEYLSPDMDQQRTNAAYRSVFRETFFDIEEITREKFSKELVADLARKIRASNIRAALVAALDTWTVIVRHVKDDDGGWTQLVLSRIATDADPDDWRYQVRVRMAMGSQVEKFFGSGKIGDLAELAAEVQFDKQSPHILGCLAQMMIESKLDAKPLLNAAMLQYPGDFWLTNALATQLSDRDARVHAFRNLTAIRPKSAVSFNNLGTALSGIGDSLSAEKAFRRALELEPNYAAPYTNLAGLFWTQKKFDESIEASRKSIELDKDVVQGWTYLGIALRETGEFDESAEALRQALMIARQSPAGIVSPKVIATILHYLGNTESERKNYDQAAKAFEEAIRLEPNRLTAGIIWSDLAKCLAAQGRFDRAREAVDQSLELAPEFLSNWLYSAELYERPGVEQLDKAEDAYRQAVVMSPKSVEARLRLGQNLFQQRRFADAIPVLQEALDLAPERPAVWLNLGTALAQNEQFDEAVEALRAAENLDAKFTPHRLLFSGGALMNRGAWNEAAKTFEEAIEAFALHAPSSPYLANAFHSLAKLRRDQGLLEDASKILREAVQRFPTDPQIRRELSRIHWIREQIPTILGDLKTIRALPPIEQLRLLDLRATLCLGRNRFDDAAEAARRMSELEVATKVTHFNAARILTRCAEAIVSSGDSPAEDEEEQRALFNESIELLKKSVAAGWDDLDRMRSDDALKALHDLPSYRKLSNTNEKTSTEASTNM